MKRKRKSKGLGSAGTVLSRLDDLPKLIQEGKCSSALTQLLYVHEDYAELPQTQRFNDPRLHGALTRLSGIDEKFKKSCLRDSGLAGTFRRK